MSGIHTYGDTVHLFIERKNYRGPFMPGFRKWETVIIRRIPASSMSTTASATLAWNRMNPWVKFYEDVMGFRNILSFDDKESRPNILP